MKKTLPYKNQRVILVKSDINSDLYSFYVGDDKCWQENSAGKEHIIPELRKLVNQGLSLDKIANGCSEDDPMGHHYLHTFPALEEQEFENILSSLRKQSSGN